MSASMFPTLLKHWRGARGLSQLALAAAADVSSRHISFLETGRSKPSREMVLRLGACLDVPLREQNVLLHAVGLTPHFVDDDVDELSAPVSRALQRMLAQQEPYPLTVLNRQYDIIMANAASTRLLPMFVADPAFLSERNVYRLLFDPRGLRPFIDDWSFVARMMLAELQSDALHRPDDDGLHLLISEILHMEGVPTSWRAHDFTLPRDPVLTVRLVRDGMRLSFFTTVTTFRGPQAVALDEVYIESYFPLDDETESLCHRLAGKDDR